MKRKSDNMGIGQERASAASPSSKLNGKVVLIAAMALVGIVSAIIAATAMAAAPSSPQTYVAQADNAESSASSGGAATNQSFASMPEETVSTKFEDVDEIPGHSNERSVESVAVNVSGPEDSFEQLSEEPAAQKSGEEPAIQVEDFSWVTADTFASMNNDEKIELMGRMAQADAKRSGILPSVTVAQAILESGWMESGLAQRNNLFGMKAVISGNTWGGSTWDGTVVDMETGEEYGGQYVSISAGFRAYDNCWLSVQDHSAYLANAMNGSSLRYDGIVGNKDARESLEIIKGGGYATSSSYVDSVMGVIEANDLTRFDQY